MSEKLKPVEEEGEPTDLKRPVRKSAKRAPKKTAKKESEESDQAELSVDSPSSESQPTAESGTGEPEEKTVAKTQDLPTEPGSSLENQGAVEGDESERQDSGKRKRKRRRGRSDGSESVSRPKLQVDPEVLSKAAWKIYLAEISEEGVALIGDKDAKELAKRCFRLAEIFLEERSRQCERETSESSN